LQLLTSQKFKAKAKRQMKKLNYYFLIAVAVAATSCNKDDETPQLTVVEAQKSMSKLSTDMSADIVDLIQSEGVNAIGELVSLLNLNDPFGGRVMSENEAKDWFKRNAILLKTIFLTKSINSSRTNDHGFDFIGNWGEYNWNPVTEQFVKTQISTEIIVINFPEEGSTSNNISLKLTDYSELLIEDEFEHYYMPTILAADLSINGVKQIELDLDAQYTDVGDPEKANVSLYLNPFTFTISFDVTSTKQSSGKASLSKGQEVIAAVDVVVDFLSVAKEELDNISGFVQYRNIKIQGSVDVNGIETASNPDMNNFVKLTLYDGANKIGDIEFVTELIGGVEEDVPYVKYNDGTKQKLEDVLQPVFDELENLSTEIDSWG
jgi:hypothetical protein